MDFFEVEKKERVLRRPLKELERALVIMAKCGADVG